MNILVLNAGSSSVKFQLVATDEGLIASSTDRRMARGQIERIGGQAILTLTAEGRSSEVSTAAIRGSCRLPTDH